MGGRTPCVPLPTGAVHTVWDSFSLLSESKFTPPPDGAAAAAVKFTLPIAVPIVLITALPGLYLLFAWILRCNNNGAVLGTVGHMLRTVDQYGMKHRVLEGDGPVQRSTALGGALAISAIGVAAAISAGLIIDFLTSNSVTRLPLLAPTSNSYVGIPPATARSGNGYANVGDAASGVHIRIHTMGVQCVLEAWTVTSLLAGNFTHRVSYNETSGESVHDFACPDCALTAISALDLYFDASCQTFLVLASAVSSTGFESLASYVVSAPCGPLASTYPGRQGCAALSGPVPAVAMTMTLDLLQVDGLDSERGFSVMPRTTLPPDGVNSSSGVLLRVALPLSEAYVSRGVDMKTSLAQLASSILGLVGILSAAGASLSLIETLPRYLDVMHCPSRPCGRTCRKRDGGADSLACSTDLVVRSRGRRDPLEYETTPLILA